MPPESEVRPWILIYYAEPGQLTVGQYWNSIGRGAFESDKTDLKANSDIRKAATEAIGTTTDAEEKLRKLFDFTRAKITNPFDDASGARTEDLEKFKANNGPADTLKRGVGTAFDIDMLFGALASAAGFDVRVARLSDRSDVFFDPSFKNSYFLSTYDIAIKVGDRWRFFNPGSRYVPFGMLAWSEEGVPALIPDAKAPEFVRTAMSQPDNSMKKRTAKLRLLEDGTLEGDVQVEYTGHFANDEKEFYDALNTAEQEQEVTGAVKEQLSTAQVSAIVLENAKDPVKPLSIRYHVKVPQYAQRTGKRLFFQPGFFEQGTGATFSSGSRTYDISFPFAWSEQDDVTIEFPSGFELETPEAPASLQAPNVASLAIKMATDGRVLRYERRFSFGGNGALVFPAAQYVHLKKLFDEFDLRNASALTLRESSAPAR
jgi:hypothetical protein